MVTTKVKMMRVNFEGKESQLHQLPNIQDFTKLNDQMMSMSRRGVFFPKASSFEIVEVDVEEQTTEIPPPDQNVQEVELSQ